jgi:L,D-transpeptidase catalytic domain
MAAMIHATPYATVQASTSATTSKNSVLAALIKAGVSDRAAEKAAAGYVWAQTKKDGHLNTSTMAVVDFSKSSDTKRLTIVDLNKGSLIGEYYVAHGSGSGLRYATSFSNTPDSHKSSLGVFTVGQEYYGEHGLSRHMVGLEPGINDNAARRDIELHRASYVSQSFIKTYGRAGGTWGCFGINPENADTIIKQLPTNTVLFAYAQPENNDSNLS